MSLHNYAIIAALIIAALAFPVVVAWIVEKITKKKH